MVQFALAASLKFCSVDPVLPKTWWKGWFGKEKILVSLMFRVHSLGPSSETAPPLVEYWVASMNVKNTVNIYYTELMTPVYILPWFRIKFQQLFHL